MFLILINLCAFICLPYIALCVVPGTIQAGVWEHWSQSVALMEDLALRGFAPLVRSQEKLSFDQRIQLSKLQQVSSGPLGVTSLWGCGGREWVWLYECGVV